MGPKEVRNSNTNSPEITVDANVKVCKDCTLEEADTEMLELELFEKTMVIYSHDLNKYGIVMKW